MRTGLKLLPVILLVLALPSELFLIPLYRELRVMQLLDTLWALMLPFLASPLVIFLLAQALKRIDWEIFEAAHIDGADHWTVMWRIVVPLLRSELLAAGIIGFAAHWNLVLFPKVVISEPTLWTIQVFLNELLKNQPLEWGLLGAAALVSTLPILMLYLFFEQRIIKVFELSLH
jgi:multiple sugar transport system permease protein